MKYVTLPLLFFINIVVLNAQNLVQNGSFEDYKSCILNREQAVHDAEPWYIAGGTPDAYQFNCNDPNLYESNINTPYSGEVFISIGGGGFQGFAYFAEGLGIELTEPLEAGKQYLFEMKTRSYRFNGTDAVPRNQCATTPKQELSVYLSQDSFKITNEYQTGLLVDSYTNGHLVYSNSSNQIIPPYRGVNSNFFTDEVVVPWETISICVQATGGERFLGISLQVGQYQVDPNCQSSATFFPVHYINLDNIRLTKAPAQIEVNIPICIDEPNEVRLRELIPEALADIATFRWSDGNSADVRNVFREGAEAIDVILQCDTVLLLLTLDGTDCKTYINMPSAFSPNNFDGINDEVKPFIRNYWEITNYEYQVYSRWGQLLFKTNDYNIGWNGQVSGEMMGEGVYIWMVKYEQNEDGKIKSYVKSGDFMLMK